MTHSLCLPWIFNDPLKHGRLLFLPFLPVLKLTRLSRMQSAAAAMSGDWCVGPDFQAVPLFRQSAIHQVGQQAKFQWGIDLFRKYISAFFVAKKILRDKKNFLFVASQTFITNSLSRFNHWRIKAEKGRKRDGKRDGKGTLLTNCTKSIKDLYKILNYK